MFRILTIFDEFTQQSLAIDVAWNMNQQMVMERLTELAVDEMTGAIARLAEVDWAGLRAVIDLEMPRQWTPSDAWIRLSDQPSERLDLR